MPAIPQCFANYNTKNKAFSDFHTKCTYGYYKNKLRWKFQRSLFFSCNRALFVQFVCGAQHAKLCAAVQLMAYFLLLFALDCVYKLFGENIVLL